MAGPSEDALTSALPIPKTCGEIEADRAKYCPDELEEHRREMNEPRRRPKETIAKMSNSKIFMRKVPIENRREFNLPRRRPQTQKNGRLKSRRPQPAEQRQPPTPWQNQRFAGAARRLEKPRR